MGTDIRRMDILFLHAGFLKNNLVRSPQIQLILPIFLPVKQLLVITLIKFLCKFLRHFAAHLKTVLADAWANTGGHILRSGAKCLAHGV